MTNIPKQDFPCYRKLRRMHDSLYLTIPSEWVSTRELNAHDEYLLQPEADGSIKLIPVREGRGALGAEAEPCPG